jgi:hypothetical protein
MSHINYREKSVIDNIGPRDQCYQLQTFPRSAGLNYLAVENLRFVGKFTDICIPCAMKFCPKILKTLAPAQKVDVLNSAIEVSCRFRDIYFR